MDHWYYIHLGQTYGPVSGEQLRKRAETGRLDASDPIWRQDIDPSDAVPAGSVLVFFLSGQKPKRRRRAAPQAQPQPQPDWLRELIDAQAGDAPEATAPQRAAPAPDWLQDVRRAEELPAPRPGEERPGV